MTIKSDLIKELKAVEHLYKECSKGNMCNIVDNQSKIKMIMALKLDNITKIIDRLEDSNIEF